MTIKEKAKSIIELVGGVDNIRSVTHCITRLRFTLANNAIAKGEEIKKIEGIIGVQEQGGQFQVIIGGEVPKVYKEVLALYPSLAQGGDTTTEVVEKKSLINRMLDTLSSILVASLYPIVGGGMLKGFVYLLVSQGIIDGKGGTFLILNLVSDCMFYFFPFLLAISAAKRFKTNEYMALSLAGALMYPAFATSGVDTIMFMGFVPIIVVNYASSVLPIILGVWIMSFIFRFFENRMPSMLNIIFTPTLTLLIAIPFVMFCIAPIGYYIGEYVAIGLDKLISFAPWLAGFVVASTRPFLVLAGMHHAIRPLTLQQISTYGFSTIGAMNFMSTMAQASAALAIYVVAKNKSTKQISAGSTISGFLGITEPALYGVIFKYRAALIGTFLGAGIGGMISATFGARAYAAVMPSIVSTPAYLGEGTFGFFLGFLASVVATFVITVFLSKSMFKLHDEDGAVAAVSTVPAASSIIGTKHTLHSPVNGTAFSIKDVKDDTFASEMLGKAIVIDSDDGKVFAPADGTIASIFPTKHALAIVTDAGAEVLIHIGVDTVSLEGRHFTAHCKPGPVKRGDLLISFDRAGIEKEGLAASVIMLISNTDNYASVEAVATSGKVGVADKAMVITE
ncbi:MAG: glucose PTS transporter subunit IIA [Deferribacteraceae bacterium]|jgi:PTS system beta-glucosides-specific IIC component|nr:glucose PTS transporter subunit IIA [Deferribacteraceae bacterium]